MMTDFTAALKSLTEAVRLALLCSKRPSQNCSGLMCRGSEASGSRSPEVLGGGVFSDRPTHQRDQLD